jgi:branched-chain amino acid transport system ATP-binding protein
MEEDRLIPLPREHLTAEDWQEIEAAFTGHSDPLFGAEAEHEYQNLFHKIVYLGPPPLGGGPA